MNHPTLVRTLSKDGEEIRQSLTALDCHLLHMVFGISGEAGELLDSIKKAVIYRKEIDLVNVVEELGDLEFYLEGLRQALFLDRDKILTKNMEKLELRYGSKYSNQSAIERKDKNDTTQN